MNFVQLTIDRIAIHQVFPRGEDGKEIPPGKGTELINFDDEALNDFKQRIVNSLGYDSSAVEMVITNDKTGSTPFYVNNMHGSNDEKFIENSYEIAKNLSKAQTRRGISGGIIVVFSATYQYNKLPLVGIIKADLYSGYEKAQDKISGIISLKHVKELLLTPSTRLYKSAGFFKREGVDNDSALSDQWIVHISDYQIDKSDGKAAAQYFYQTFLGCDYPATSARTTKRYFELACDFISHMDISEEARTDLYNVLYADLNTGKSQTVDPMAFASKYMYTADIDNFRNYLEDSNFPVAPFIKDIEYIAGKLKNRRIKFSKNIRIIAPSEVFEEFVTIETMKGEKQQDGYTPTWTKILVKDRIVDQE
ncbi:hypothetical protein EXT60_13520 [Pectobacterium carotovorum subsp. carotovorum]|nr:nucleoid-associated protein [Pectobacterium carotovorum]MCL6365257.1 hypothetical protein [Pectobacterium carotovorum subsp. carotovorum]